MPRVEWLPSRRGSLLLALAALAWLLSACRGAPPASHPAQELIFADWEGDMPQSVLDAFTAEYGIQVDYVAYASQEEEIEAIRAGQPVDVLVLESRLVPQAVTEGLLAPIDYHYVPNFKNISANFRGLMYDPDNQYSIPYNWGTIGLIVTKNPVEAPITRWSDLWDARYAGRIYIWTGEPRLVIAMALKSLGYSANSENELELQAALAHLISLKQSAVFVQNYTDEGFIEVVSNGSLAATMGYGADIAALRQQDVAVDYVYPQEGALLWSDNYVIPAHSLNPSGAEVFINFLLRPEISAQIANSNYYATPNEAAFPLIDSQIRDDPVIYPPSDSLEYMEIVMPLSPAGQALYDRIWAQFLLAAPAMGQP